MTQAYLLKLDISGQLETFERTETWGSRYAVVIQCFDPADLNCMANIFFDMVTMFKAINRIDKLWPLLC